VVAAAAALWWWLLPWQPCVEVTAAALCEGCCGSLV